MRSPGYSQSIGRRDRSTPETGRVERHVAGQAAELRHHDRGLRLPGLRQGLGQPGPALQRVGSLDLHRFREHLALRFRAGLRRFDPPRGRAAQFNVGYQISTKSLIVRSDFKSGAPDNY